MQSDNTAQNSIGTSQAGVIETSEEVGKTDRIRGVTSNLQEVLIVEEPYEETSLQPVVGIVELAPTIVTQLTEEFYRSMFTALVRRMSCFNRESETTWFYYSCHNP